MTGDRRLPVVVDMASPCPLTWDELQGDEASRFCARCNKSVVNLALLTAEQGAAAVARGSCVRLQFRADGSVVSADSKRGAGRTGLVLAASLAAALGCNSQKARPDVPVMIGSAAVVAPPPSSSAPLPSSSVTPPSQKP
ncbi:MAG: hypothetical protein QM756_09345 [Polyangiaceae bacterium]